MLEAFSFCDGRLEFIIRSLEFGGALLNARFKLVMGAAQIVLGAPPLDKLANFAADGGHHVQKIRLWFHSLRCEKFEDSNEIASTLDRKSHGTLQTGCNRGIMSRQIMFLRDIGQPHR